MATGNVLLDQKEALPLLFDRHSFVERLLDKQKDALIWEKPRGFDVYDFHVDFSSATSDPEAALEVRPASFVVGAADSADVVGMAVVPQGQHQARHHGPVLLSGRCPADSTPPGKAVLTAGELHHELSTGMSLSQLTIGPTTHWWLFARVPEAVLASPTELKAALDAKQIPLIAKTPSENISVGKPQYGMLSREHKWHRHRLVVAGSAAHSVSPIPGVISPESLVSGR